MDRTTATPGRALSDSLESLTRRVEAAEMRGMWPSAIHESSVDVQADGYVTPTFLGDPLDYKLVTSLELDAGRWVLFGSVTHKITRWAVPLSGDSGFTFNLKVSAHAGPDLIGEREVDGWSERPEGFFTIAFHVVAVEAISEGIPITAKLWVAAAGGPSDANPLVVSVQYYLYSATLLAFPG